MTNVSMEKLLETQESFRRQFEPLSAQMKALQENSAVKHLAQHLDRHRELMRAAFGPLEELRRAGLLNPASRWSRG